MYIIIQKGVRAWGVGTTPRRAMEEAIDHGAGNVLVKDVRIFPCSLRVAKWFINSLYPEEMDDIVFREDGSVCLRRAPDDQLERLLAELRGNPRRDGADEADFLEALSEIRLLFADCGE